MADNKKSIIVYADWGEQFETLTDEEAGKLIKHFFRYVNDLDPIAPDRLTEIAFTPIKQSLKRDLLKWEIALQNRSLNGRTGNLKRWNTDLYNQVIDNLITIDEAEFIANSRKLSHSDKNVTVATESIANIADNVNVSVSDIKKDIPDKSDIINWVELLKFFNAETKKNCKVIPNKAKTNFTARLKEGYSKQDFAKAIKNCAADEYHINNPKYLTLEFISRADKLEMYLNVGSKPKTVTETQNPKNLRVLI